MKKTIAQTRIEEMTAKGYELAGRTSGFYSFRKGSNLSRKMESLGLSETNCKVLTAARAGKHLNDGYELLIFTKA